MELNCEYEGCDVKRGADSWDTGIRLMEMHERGVHGGGKDEKKEEKKEKKEEKEEIQTERGQIAIGIQIWVSFGSWEWEDTPGRLQVSAALDRCENGKDTSKKLDNTVNTREKCM